MRLCPHCFGPIVLAHLEQRPSGAWMCNRKHCGNELTWLIATRLPWPGARVPLNINNRMDAPGSDHAACKRALLRPPA